MSRRDLDAQIDVGSMRKLKKRERTFEYALRDELQKMGVMFVKLKPTIEFFPDRLAIGCHNMKLVETKSEDGELSEGQKLMRRDLGKLGIKVLVVKKDVRSAALLIHSALRER